MSRPAFADGAANAAEKAMCGAIAAQSRRKACSDSVKANAFESLWTGRDMAVSTVSPAQLLVEVLAQLHACQQ